MPDFLDVVATGWSASLFHVDPFRALHYKFLSVAKALKSWSSKWIGSVWLQLSLTREVILALDVAEESRALSSDEKVLQNELKMKCLGLASLNRTIQRQRSKVLFLAEGDANTKFFHLQAYHRKRKSIIPSLMVQGSEVLQNEEMANALFDHFNSLLGQPFSWWGAIGLHTLGVPSVDLGLLDGLFSEQEVWETIKSLPPDKAPGPDGFNGVFYRQCWLIIKSDIMRAFNAF
jgi:hypothetical protein